MKRFSDFASGDNPLEGDKIKLDAILNREIEVTGFTIKGSNYVKTGGEKCLKLQFTLDEKKYILFTGSHVLADQVEKYKEELPFVTVIKKIDKFYTMT